MYLIKEFLDDFKLEHGSNLNFFFDLTILILIVFIVFRQSVSSNSYFYNI